MGRKRRAHSVEYIVKLMCKLSDKYGVKVFYFHDDHFTLDNEWLRRILR